MVSRFNTSHLELKMSNFFWLFEEVWPKPEMFHAKAYLQKKEKEKWNK
jgi:hypothetical protein